MTVSSRRTCAFCGIAQREVMGKWLHFDAWGTFSREECEEDMLRAEAIRRKRKLGLMEKKPKPKAVEDFR